MRIEARALLIASLGLGLAGCGGNSPEDPDATPTGVPYAPTTLTATPDTTLEVNVNRLRDPNVCFDIGGVRRPLSSGEQHMWNDGYGAGTWKCIRRQEGTETVSYNFRQVDAHPGDHGLWWTRFRFDTPGSVDGYGRGFFDEDGNLATGSFVHFQRSPQDR